MSAARDGSAMQACQVRDWGLWEALDAFGEAFAASSGHGLDGDGDGEAACYLRQVALQDAVAEQMRIRATIDIHRALLAGAAPQEIAHVLGVGVAVLDRRWRCWAEGQRRLRDRCPGLGMGRGEYERAAAVLDGAGDDLDQFTSCACRGEVTQIGSPRL